MHSFEMGKIRKMFKMQEHSVNSNFLPLLEMKIAKVSGDPTTKYRENYFLFPLHYHVMMLKAHQWRLPTQVEGARALKNDGGQEIS